MHPIRLEAAAAEINIMEEIGEHLVITVAGFKKHHKSYLKGYFLQLGCNFFAPSNPVLPPHHYVQAY